MKSVMINNITIYKIGESHEYLVSTLYIQTNISVHQDDLRLCSSSKI